MTAVPLEINHESSEDDTFSDIQDDDDNKIINKDENGSNIEDGSDDFDFEKPKRLQLKPSKIQQKAEQKKDIKTELIDTNNNDDDDVDDDDGVTIQSNVLSEYLKPTSILSKYQSISNESEADEIDESSQQEEEEKEWPTINVTREQNTESNNEDIEDNDGDEFEIFEEEKTSDFEPIEFNDLCSYLIQKGDDTIDSEDIIIEDFRNISW
eukprot:CAMPEP_0201596910 /NCGR_PEP_ID=MMETSP0190_2-20130828/193503_1 /ASSEMBLY_ACC=CAM_ASM_000263 /TAXON_ID=37353 /ORGANISM="Rosalina sp." /LENGTH=209 /DNA_ID=CAMNT_0048057553 /DNA_START=21 /DNA_END=647 /DNA_ORIENTATION=+